MRLAQKHETARMESHSSSMTVALLLLMATFGAAQTTHGCTVSVHGTCLTEQAMLVLKIAAGLQIVRRSSSCVVGVVF